MKAKLAWPMLPLILAMAACSDKNREDAIQRKDSQTVVHSDSAGAGKYLNPPTLIKANRWTEVPVVGAPGRLTTGPSDFRPNAKRIYMVLTLNPADWLAWKRSLKPIAAPDIFFLDEELAIKLLPPDWLASTAPYSRDRRRIEGEWYNPDSIIAPAYKGLAAVRHGDHLLLELFSK